MIQARGLVGIIEAADVMAKTANIRIVGYQKSGDGIVTVIARGSVADCRAAVDAAAAAVNNIGELLGSHVIPNPDESVNRVLPVI